jgi:hypothetical protein
MQSSWPVDINKVLIDQHIQTVVISLSVHPKAARCSAVQPLLLLPLPPPAAATCRRRGGILLESLDSVTSEPPKGQPRVLLCSIDDVLNIRVAVTLHSRSAKNKHKQLTRSTNAAQ